MEDLKKQTAKRLAQEQNRQNRQTLNPSQGKKKGPQQVTGRKGEDLPVIRVKQHKGLGSNEPTAMANEVHGQGSQRAFRKLHSNKIHAPHDSIHQAGSFRQHPKIKVHENYYREPPVPVLKVRRQVFAAPTHKPTVGHTNTLPHGLTVTELKEMTRARLATESSVEIAGNHQSLKTGGNQRYSVRIRSDEYGHRLKPTRQRFRSHDGISPRNRINSSESLSSAPPDVVHYGDPRQRNSFSPRNPIRKSYSHEGHDNVSVTSFNSIGSEYMSDMSGVHTIQSSLNEDASRYSLNQTLSFSSENRANEVPREETSKGGIALFDSSNRRRALTASPPTLSNLLEDKPLTNAFLNQNESGAQGLGLFHYVGQKSDSSSRGPSPTTLQLQSDQSDIWGDIFGRPESITVAPTLTQSFESLETKNDNGSLPTRAFIRQNSLGGMVPNSVAESVLDPSPPQHQGSTHSKLLGSQLFGGPLRSAVSWGSTDMTDKVGGDQLVMSQLGNDLNSFLRLQSGEKSHFTSFRSLSQSEDLPLAQGALERLDGPSLFSPSFEDSDKVQNVVRAQDIQISHNGADVNSSHNIPVNQKDFVQERGILE